ncbi:unnamed protein product [Arabis nemorensis]|uniref:Uncharacterized protein n=1 Tax=Arabis nemorensis TaxID=586526 RepID=A0A565CN14_9BRAS|nr:unnamed protein product [Arabis nemorensis]
MSHLTNKRNSLSIFFIFKNFDIIAKNNVFSSRGIAIRNGHTSTYDKNVEEELQSNKVPDELIKPDSDKYWSPHPQTGVFGPSSSSTDTTDKNRGGQEDSMMKEKAWFRPTSLEDLDKTRS